MSVTVHEQCPHCGTALPLEYKRVSSPPTFTYNTTYQPSAQICPLCMGVGSTGMHSQIKFTCRACGGKGIVWPPRALAEETKPS